MAVRDGCHTHSCILNLPSEIVERIFWSMDESTFFISLHVCRQFLEVGSSLKNLQLQVSRLPGFHAELAYLRGIVYRTECHRAASTSGCMAWVLADIANTALPKGTLVSQSVISMPSSMCSQSAARDVHMALANEDGSINIYSLADNDVRYVTHLTLDYSEARDRPTRIARLAFSPHGDLLVLHGRNEQTRDNGSARESPYSKSEPGIADARQLRQSYELSTFCGCFGQRQSRECCNTKHRRYQISALEGATPMSLAHGRWGCASIVWCIKTPEVLGAQYRIEILISNDLDMSITMVPTRTCYTQHYADHLKGKFLSRSSSNRMHNLSSQS